MTRLIMFTQMIAAIPFIIVFAGVLLFIPARTLKWIEGWVYIVMLVVYYVIMTSYFIIIHPSTLIKRKKLSSSKVDNIFLIIFGLVFLLVIILPGFDYQFQWTQLPILIKAIGFIGVVISYIINFWVMKANSNASKGLTIHEDHLIVTTGPYGIIRHPMYVSFIVLAFSTPIALGSLASLILALVIPIFLVYRIRNEEEMLKKSLSGYVEYMGKVQYRLIPKMW